MIEPVVIAVGILVLGFAWFYKRRSARRLLEFRRWRMEDYRRTRSGR
jgi:hypothetical protein